MDRLYASEERAQQIGCWFITRRNTRSSTRRASLRVSKDYTVVALPVLYEAYTYKTRVKATPLDFRCFLGLLYVPVQSLELRLYSPPGRVGRAREGSVSVWSSRESLRHGRDAGGWGRLQLLTFCVPLRADLLIHVITILT